MTHQLTLKSFHVRLFRNIVDSEVVDVNDVTALVGKNEAGKSALLQALHHLNPAKPEASLSLLDEYPRWLKKEHEITGEVEHAVPITATFVISSELLAHLSEQFGDGTILSEEVEFSRTYGEPNKLQVNIQTADQPFIDRMLGNGSQRLRRAVGQPKSVEALLESVANLVARKADGEDDDAGVGGDAEELTERLKDALGAHETLRAAINDKLKKLLPKTFYFSSYSQLDGRYRLDDVFAAVKRGSEDESLKAAADFLELAKVVPETVEDWDFEKSNAELEAISSLLTKRVKEHWKQNDHLKLRVNLETQQETIDSQVQAVRYLQFRVEDTRHDFSSRLDRRSTGFRWFISFIASFLEFEKEKNLILLLDEPGLSLHARAQMDLLDTLEEKVARGRQVLYSTHSPFMVKADRLNRTRIIEDQGPERGSVVVNEAGRVTDPDTLFPLQAALGYDIAQSLFIGDDNVLVEGVSDFLYITAISNHLARIGRASLRESCRILPAGGAANIPAFIALIGTKLDVVVLLDGNSDRQRIDMTITQGRLDPVKVLTMNSYSNIKGADIEDLFTVDEYLAIYNECFDKSLKSSDLKGDDRVVKRIARHEGAEFNHGVVAAHFVRHEDESIDRLSNETIDRFEKLIQAINSALDTK